MRVTGEDSGLIAPRSTVVADSESPTVAAAVSERSSKPATPAPTSRTCTVTEVVEACVVNVKLLSVQAEF